MKKMIHTLRNRLVTGVQLIVPVIFTIMALSIELKIPMCKLIMDMFLATLYQNYVKN
jgi:hypothetical protein